MTAKLTGHLLEQIDRWRAAVEQQESKLIAAWAAGTEGTFRLIVTLKSGKLIEAYIQNQETIPLDKPPKSEKGT